MIRQEMAPIVDDTPHKHLSEPQAWRLSDQCPDPLRIPGYALVTMWLVVLHILIELALALDIFQCWFYAVAIFLFIFRHFVTFYLSPFPVPTGTRYKGCNPRVLLQYPNLPLSPISSNWCRIQKCWDAPGLMVNLCRPTFQTFSILSIDKVLHPTLAP